MNEVLKPGSHYQWAFWDSKLCTGTFVDLLVQTGLMESRSEAKRKLKEGAVRVGNTWFSAQGKHYESFHQCKKVDETETIDSGAVIRFGRKCVILL